MKKLFNVLLVFMLLVIPFRLFAEEVSDVFVDKENKLSFTGANNYDTYQVTIKFGETTIDEFNQNCNAKSGDLVSRVTEGCESHVGVCPENMTGTYTLEIVAVDTANANALVESTRTTKTISYKHEEFNGDDYYHVDVVGNETIYTITLDPENDIDEPQIISNLKFGQEVHLSSIEDYGFTLLSKRNYYGWDFEDFRVTHDMTITPNWEPLFTMTFNFNGGTFKGKEDYTKESVGYGPSTSLENIMGAFEETEEVIAPSHKEIDYITINGVRYDVDPENGFFLNQDVIIVYYWKWTEGTTVHTITFTDGFDNLIKTVEVADGDAVAQPSTPIKGNLIFHCWKLNGDCYNFTNTVVEDKTIEASWYYNFYAEINANDVGILTYGGTDYPKSVGSSMDYHPGEILGVDQRGINGYELVEWRVGSIDGEVVGTDSSADYYMTEGGHLKIKQTPESAKLKFYAIYAKEKVAVNFETNGGTPIETEYVTPGNVVHRPAENASVKEGYLLGDWYTDQELTQEYNFSTPVQTGLTLYAGWNIYLSEVRGTVNKPVVGFHPDTNIVSLDPDKYTFEFVEWYSTENGAPEISENDVFAPDKNYEIRMYVIPAKGYAADYNTKYYINDEITSCFGAATSRQIRWDVTNPEEVSEFNIEGIVKPTVGTKFDNSNIRLTTPGLTLNRVFWTEEDTGRELTSDDKFVNGKRYILHVLFNPNYGYVLEEGYNEDRISGASGFLKAELVDQFDEYDMQIFYETKNLDTPVLTLTSSNNTITVDWTIQQVEKTELYRSTDNKKWTRVSTANSNSYTDKSLTYGKTYYYKVRVYGNSKWTSYSNVVKKKIVPAKVNNLVIKSAGTNNVKLGYDKVNVTGYEIYYSTDQKKWTKATTVTSSNTLEYNVKKLKENKKYYFKVRAYKTVSGSKVYGDYSSVVSTKTAPVKPEVTLSNRDANSLTIKITASKGANKYIVEKSLDGKEYEDYTEYAEAKSYVIDTLELGKTYYYRVKACNSLDRCSGWVSVNKKVTTKSPSVTLKTSSKKVTITVGRVNGAQGYQIYSATKKNGTYKLLKEFSNEEELLEYVHKTTKRKTYYYKVRSFALDTNDSRVYSSYSSIKSIKSK